MIAYYTNIDKGFVMPKYGKTSRARLDTCIDPIQEVMNEVIKHFDCSILCGHRTEEEQTKAFNEKRSKVQFPNSKHNSLPSNAVDAAPYPIDWNDLDRFRYFAGYVVGIAASKGYKFRWGGDWDQDTDLNDQNFNDLPHFEFVGYL